MSSTFEHQKKHANHISKTKHRAVSSPQQEFFNQWIPRKLLYLGFVTAFVASVRQSMSFLNDIPDFYGLLRGNADLLPADQEDQYTLVIVRCQDNISWVDDVPEDWKVVVYEKCGRNTKRDVHINANQLTIHRPNNEGAEECNGYLDYIYDYYYNLTSVTIFMHGDGIQGYGKLKDHTPFFKLGQLVNATYQLMTKNTSFLHFGVPSYNERFGSDPYHSMAEKILWPHIAPFRGELPKLIRFKPSAHMAVRKQEIQHQPRETYYALLQQVRYASKMKWKYGHDYPESRAFCCALERVWHVLFGQPAILPESANVGKLLNLTPN